MATIRSLNSQQKVLIVNENLLITKVVEPLIQRAGYKVVSTDNALEVYELVNDFKPDIVILDLLISFVTAYELIKFIRDVEFKYIKIIVLTKVNLEQAIVDCFNLGIDDYLCLPLQQQELLARLKRMNKYQVAIG